MRHWLAIGLCFSAVVGCSAEPGAEGGGAEALGSRGDELVGGHVASESEYPSTVSLGGCTGVKVGPRHFLSAAHCFGNPNQAQLTMTADNNAQNFVTLTISSINVHPQYTSCTACAGDGSMSDFGYRPDVALIIVQELTPSVPQAVIDPTPVALGAAVTLTGYGCENGVDQPTGPSRLKVGDTHTVDPLTLSDAASIPGGYNSTWGPALDPSAPGLCPGDSGGPLFRTGTNRVVGINALLSYTGPQKTPYGNWFTRLDQQSRYNVYGFVTNMVNTTPCTGICSSPTQLTSQTFNSGSLGTSARCYESWTNQVSGSCGGFVSPRTFNINGTAKNCNDQNWVLPAKRNGGYCFSATAGQNSWAWFSVW